MLLSPINHTTIVESRQRILSSIVRFDERAGRIVRKTLKINTPIPALSWLRSFAIVNNVRAIVVHVLSPIQSEFPM